MRVMRTFPLLAPFMVGKISDAGSRAYLGSASGVRVRVRIELALNLPRKESLLESHRRRAQRLRRLFAGRCPGPSSTLLRLLARVAAAPWPSPRLLRSRLLFLVSRLVGLR